MPTRGRTALFTSYFYPFCHTTRYVSECSKTADVCVLKIILWLFHATTGLLSIKIFEKGNSQMPKTSHVFYFKMHSSEIAFIAHTLFYFNFIHIHFYFIHRYFSTKNHYTINLKVLFCFILFEL